MKAILAILLLTSPVYAAELMPSLGENNYRCLFLSPEHNKVIHSFKIPKDFRQRCEYGIQINDTLIYQAFAFPEDCKTFMRTQMNKGSACMTDEF